MAFDFGESGGGESQFELPSRTRWRFLDQRRRDLDSTFTQEEFGINANAGSDGNDWFCTDYDSKTKSMSDSAEGGWTRHTESKSIVHEDLKQESVGNSSCTLDLSKPTGGDPSGSVALTFGGGSGDEWHVLDESEGEWEDNYDNGSGSTEINQGTSKAKYIIGASEHERQVALFRREPTAGTSPQSS